LKRIGYIALPYQKLRVDPVAALSEALRFYGIAPDLRAVEALVRRVADRTRFDLEQNLRTRQGTARKGIVGDWRNHFTDAQARRVLDVCGPRLVEWGFEPAIIGAPAAATPMEAA
jgi:hypothetical protein